MVKSLDNSVLCISKTPHFTLNILQELRFLQHVEGTWPVTVPFPVVLVLSLGPTLLHIACVSLAFPCFALFVAPIQPHHFAQ
jgi:hypothetical protein